MTHLTLNFLGQFRAAYADRPLNGFESNKVRALLAYLAVEADRPHPRAQLATLLWPGYQEESARGSLRHALHQLRQTLAAGGNSEAPAWLIASRAAIQFNVATPYTLDVHTFTTLIRQCASHAHPQLAQCEACLTRLHQAVEQYRGDFLAGLAIDDSTPFEEWRRLKQEALHVQALAALEQLTVAHEARGNHEYAHTYVLRQLELEPWREAAHRQLMRILAQLGNRSGALAQYQTCYQRLRDEFGVEPDAQTQALYEQIRSGGLVKEVQRQGLSWREDKALSPPTALVVSPIRPAAPPIISLPAIHDWGEMPTVESFEGRTAELAQLEAWLAPSASVPAGVRLVSLLGIGGIGKTTLAAVITKGVTPAFDIVIWRSLLNAPPLAEIVRNWLQILGRQTLTTFPESLDEQLRLLLDYLRQQHCLLVLDNVESILQPGGANSLAGEMRPGYEGYGQLLQLLAASEHRSCLLLTSREQPYALQRVGRQTPAVRTLSLSGLDLPAGQTILQNNGLSATAAEAALLVKNYSGNPLALQIVGNTIADFFGGDVAAFQAEEGFLFDGIRRVLDQQFARLSAFEREILVWLAIEREAVTVAMLRNNLLQKPSQSELFSALHALQARSLLENTGDGLTLQNVIIEYTTEYLVEQVCREIFGEWETKRQGEKEHEAANFPFSFLHRFALLKAQAKEYVRQSQVRLILQPILNRLLQKIDKTTLVERLQQMIATVRRQERDAKRTYIGGNIFNLLLHVGIDWSGLDFSGIAVWQAYMRGAYLPNLNLVGADLTGVALTHIFGDISTLFFRADHELVATGKRKDQLCIWRVTTGELLNQCSTVDLTIGPVGWSEEGHLAAAVNIDHTIHLFDVHRGCQLYRLTAHDHSIWKLCFSLDRQWLASGDTSGCVCVWDIRSGELRYRLHGHQAAITALAFAAGGGWLASAAVDGTLCLWDVTNGTPVYTIQAHSDEVAALVFALGDTILATGSHDCTVRLWDAPSGRPLHVLQRHTQPVRKLTVSTSGQILASYGGDSLICIWDVQAGNALHILADHPSAIVHLAISRDEQTLAALDLNDAIRLWMLPRGQPLASYRLHTSKLHAVDFSPDGQMIATGGSDWSIYLCHVTSYAHNQRMIRLTGHTHRVATVIFSPDGATVASGGFGRTIRLWDISTREGRILEGHKSNITALAFSPNGRKIVSSSGDGTLNVWDVHSGQKLRVLQGHTNGVLTCCYSPHGRQIASGSLDRTVCLWDADTGELLHTMHGHTNAIQQVVFHPDGEIIVSTGYDQSVRLWDVRSGRQLTTWSTLGVLFGSITIHPAGEILAAGGHDHVIRLLTLDTGRILGELPGHQHGIHCLKFSPDGQRLVSASADETVKLWEVDVSAGGGRCLQTFNAPGPYAGMNITGVTGISEAQKAALRALGAVEEEPSSSAFALIKPVSTAVTASEPGPASIRETVAPPAPPGPAGIPHHLPAQLTPFVGREHELADLLTQLRQPHLRLLTLVGAGGMGKTWLALEAARRLSAAPAIPGAIHPSAMTTGEDLPDFADGIVFVELAPLRADSEIVAAIITALGGNIQGQEPRTYLLQFLRDKRLLLILDNCEHLPDVADLIVELLQRAPALRIIATSRARLHVQGEQLYPVQGMGYSLDLTLATASEASAVRLFVQSVRRVQPTFSLTETNLPAVVRICQLVDGMPLGLELAATRADLLPLTTIAQEIEQNLDFLAADWRNKPERQRSLRAVFHWSWQMVSAEEQQIFGRLAIFRGGFTHAAAHAVTGASLRVLTNLCHKSLLVARPGEGRYEFHELLRQFAAQQLATDPAEAASLGQRQAGFYLDLVASRLAQLVGREPRLAVTVLQADLDNIRQAWRWAVEQGDSQALGQCTLGLSKLYEQLGLLTERNQLFALAIAALQQPGAVVTNTAPARCQQQILSRFLALQAGGLVAQGRVDEVQHLAQQAIALGAANDGWEGESFGYLAWGQSCYRQGKLAEAQQHFGQALTLARRYRPLLPALTLLNDVEATALIWLAGIAKDEGALPQAYDYLMAALQLCQMLGNVRGETRVRFNLASLAWVKRDYPTARQVYEQTLAMAQQVGDPLAAGICYLELGEVLRMQGDYGGAYQALAQAQTIFTRIGDFIQNAYAITCLGCLCVYLGDFTAAGHLHQQAAAYSDSLDSAIVKYQGLLLQALLAHISGEQRRAQTAAYNCWQVAQATKSSSRQARALVLLGHAAAGLQDHPAAATAYEGAATLFDAIGYRFSAAAEARAGLAALALHQGDPAQALALVTEFLPHLLAGDEVIGVDEPFYTYLTCYQVLAANGDSRAQAILDHGYTRLTTCADHIPDPALRHSFLHNVPIHRALQEAYLLTR